VAATALHAQPSAREPQLALEVMIVSAQRREQSAQDVALAMSVVSEQRLENALIIHSSELTTLVPTLNVQTGFSAQSSSFNIRGIGTQSFSAGAEPSIATMVDGVVLGRSGMAFMGLMDVERVEVLRGPQGTLFGKNASGGVISIVTKAPSFEHTGAVSLSALEGSDYRLGLMVSGPVSEKIGYRFAASGQQQDGYINNRYNGKDLNGTDNWSMRGKLHWQVSDKLDFMWSSDFARHDCSCTVMTVHSIQDYTGDPNGIHLSKELNFQ
jgi:iron complex outermembrane recepter protein